MKKKTNKHLRNRIAYERRTHRSWKNLKNKKLNFYETVGDFPKTDFSEEFLLFIEKVLSIHEIHGRLADILVIPTILYLFW